MSQSSATVFLMVCQLPTVRYSPRYRIHWIYEFICACNLIMRDSWIDEVHMSASWLCSLFLSHLLSLGSSDRSHNEKHPTPFFFVFPACTEKKEEGLPCALLSGSAVALGAFSLVIVLGSNGDEG